MHAEFADWYRSASLTPPEGLLQKRWNAVEELAATESADILLSLLRLYLLPNVSEGACLPDIRAVFRKHDETFPASGNLEEMRVLAGSTLRQMFESDEPLGSPAALGILAGSFPGREREVPTARHIDAADAFAARAAGERRRRGDEPRFSMSELSKKRFEEIFTPAVAAASPAGFPDPIRNLLNEVLNSVRTAMDNAVASLESDIRTKEEELDYLWWLTAAHSKSLGLPFSEVGAIRGALVYATELAELTVHVPGPASAIAIMLRALLLSGASTTTETVSLAAAVNSVDRSWREQIARAFGTADVDSLCPVALAIAKSLDTEGDSDWLPVFRKACDIRPETSIALGVLGRQVFRERMFIRSLADATT